MPTIFLDYLPAQLRENKRWYIEYYVKHPQTGKLRRKTQKINRISKITERRKLGKRLVAKINKKLEQGWNPFIEESGVKSYNNIYDVFEIYLNVKKKELRRSSFVSYKSDMNILSSFLKQSDTDAKMFIIDFTKETAVNFLNYMYIKRNVSETRYNGILIFCKSLFSWMQQYNYVKSNPFSDIKRKKQKTKTREIIPGTVREKIKNFLLKENVEFLVFLMIEFHALLRPKEILGLRIYDIDLKNQVISVNKENAKNGKYRLVTIPNNLVEFIKLLKLENYNENLFVFSDKLKPGRVQKLTKYAGRRWINLRKSLNLKTEYQMYSLRDSGIINLFQSGVSPEEVAKQAGHSDLSITSIYALHANKIANEQIKSKTMKF